MKPLNDVRSIWLAPEALGTVQVLRHRGRRVQYKPPTNIEHQATLRFRGYGRTQGQESGDLLLQVRVDRGRDVPAVLWLPASDALDGANKGLRARGQRQIVTVPPRSRDGQVVRVPGAGEKNPFQWGLPLFGRRKGDLCVTLRVFPDGITPNYGSVDRLSDADLALEGWVYRRIDLIYDTLGRKHFERPALTAVDAANLYNEGGWRMIANRLCQRMGLTLSQSHFQAVPDLPVPGQCRREIKTQGGRMVSSRNEISIRRDFLDDPFAVVAILAHELCHVIHARHLAPSPTHVSKPGPELLEEERTVDILVFMFQLGEFQMRVARQRQSTLGYFNQTLFERLQVILARKRPPPPR